jgi:PKD repeat protein
VQFTNLSAGDIGAYQWNFGDGGSSTETNPSHIYEDPGTYSVTLTVIGTIQGKIATKERKDYITAQSACAIASSLSNRGQINDLRALRDARLEDISGMLLTSIYYRNVAEINTIFDEQPVLRSRFKDLVADNGAVVKDLLQGRSATVSPSALAEIIQYLEAVKARSSVMLQQDIDFVIVVLENGFLLNGLGITVR